MVTPRFIPTCSKELLEGLGRIAAKNRARGCWVQSHLAEVLLQLLTLYLHRHEYFGSPNPNLTLNPNADPNPYPNPNPNPNRDETHDEMAFVEALHPGRRDAQIFDAVGDPYPYPYSPQP